jgi:hypothetical protein
VQSWPANATQAKGKEWHLLYRISRD